jgi:hypothetical protein
MASSRSGNISRTEAAGGREGGREGGVSTVCLSSPTHFLTVSKKSWARADSSSSMASSRTTENRSQISSRHARQWASAHTRLSSPPSLPPSPPFLPPYLSALFSSAI